MLRACATHGCKLDILSATRDFLPRNLWNTRCLRFRRYRLSEMTKLVNMHSARCDTGAHGAAHGLLPARSQRAAWPCVHRLETPANAPTCRRRVQPIQAVLTVSCATMHMFHRLQRQTQHPKEIQQDAVVQAERPAATLSEIQKWGDDRRLQTQVCSNPRPVSLVCSRGAAQTHLIGPWRARDLALGYLAGGH